jgi:hypothetical protein
LSGDVTKLSIKYLTAKVGFVHEIPAEASKIEVKV